MSNDDFATITQSGPKSIVITFPSGTRARVKTEVRVADLLRVIEEDDSLRQDAPIMLQKPDPV